MARRGDGIYQRGRTWWLDFIHEEKRHYVRLGRNISKTVAGEIAKVKRGAILKGEAGIGGPKRADLIFDKAAEEFLAWSKANKRPRTQRIYGQCIARLKLTFTGKRLSDISAFDLERYKRDRVDAGVTVMVNRELACLKTLYNRCREWGSTRATTRRPGCGSCGSHRGGSGSSRPTKRESSWALRSSRCAP